MFNIVLLSIIIISSSNIFGSQDSEQKVEIDKMISDTTCKTSFPEDIQMIIEYVKLQKIKQITYALQNEIIAPKSPEYANQVNLLTMICKGDLVTVFNFLFYEILYNYEKNFTYLESILKTGKININDIIFPNEKTPLCLAIKCVSVDTCKFLIDHGAIADEAAKKLIESELEYETKMATQEPTNEFYIKSIKKLNQIKTLIKI